MRPYFHLLLLFSLFQLTGCGEEEVVQLPDDPTFEETTDPADVFTVECANHAPELYLSVTDKEATPILHMASDGQPEVGKIGIRGVHYAESDAPGSFTLTYDPERARVAIYPEEMWRFLDRFEETGDSIRFYGKRPISGVADSVVIPFRELWLRLVVEWTSEEADTLALRYQDACDIQLTCVCLAGDSVGFNQVTLVK